MSWQSWPYSCRVREKNLPGQHPNLPNHPLHRQSQMRPLYVGWKTLRTILGRRRKRLGRCQGGSCVWESCCSRTSVPSQERKAVSADRRGRDSCWERSCGLYRRRKRRRGRQSGAAFGKRGFEGRCGKVEIAGTMEGLDKQMVQVSMTSLDGSGQNKSRMYPLAEIN